jgi:hypothetical protein
MNEHRRGDVFAYGKAYSPTAAQKRTLREVREVPEPVVSRCSKRTCGNAANLEDQSILYQVQ